MAVDLPSTTLKEFQTPLASGADITYDVKVVTTGTNVTVEVYQGGVSAASITYASSLAAPDAISFDHYDITTVWNTYYYYYSECMVTDGESTISWRLASLAPSANGTHTDWSGAVADIIHYGDGLGISSSTAGQKESWTLSTYSGSATSSAVRAVVNKFYGSSADGSTYLLTDPPLVMDVLDDNPQTTLGWNTGDLATLQIGVKSAT